MIDPVGQQFDNYRLIRLLGHGGFADVYLGIYVVRNTQVAVKVLHDSLNQEDLPTFLEEVRNLLRLRHPYIVPLLDFNQQHAPPFIIMGYAPNGTLRQRHPARAILSPQTIVTYINQVAVALQYAHDEKIIHRDVKPQNMLLGANNEVLLSDFGIATVAHSTYSIHMNKQLVAGTPTYMAPEQILGKACPAGDQYALGVVVYEWLCGRPPFEGNSSNLYHQHLNNVPQPLHERVPDIPPTVEQVVLQALAKKPEERHSNLTTFAEALERAMRFSQQPNQILHTPQSQSGPADQQPGPPAEPPAQRTQVVIQQPSPSRQFRGEGVTQALEVLSLQAPRNDQRRNLTPPSGSFEQLWREAVQAQVRGESEQAFRLLRKITTLPGLAPSQKEAVKTQIRSFRQMIPLCLRQAREAVSQGRWQDEIQAWENLLALEPSMQEIIQQLTIHPKGSIKGNIQERLRIARQNKNCAWMYSQTQRFIREQDDTAARAQLEILWKNAPMYGDPAGLAQRVGLPPAINYEQALVEEQARQQREREKAERERQRQEAERRKKQEEVERERQRQERQEAERQKKQQKREIILSGGAGAGAAAAIGAAAGALLTLVATSGVAETALAFPVESAIEKFLSAVTLWVGFTEVIWGAILGALVGLVVGALTKSPEVENTGGGWMTGVIIGVAAGAATGALVGASYGGGVWGIVLAIIGACIGGYIGMYAGIIIAGIIMAIIDPLTEKIW